MIKLPGGIPLTISPYFWLLAILLGWLNSASLQGIALWIPIILVSVLIHELGHALTAKAFGQQAEIELVAYGGVTRRTGVHLRTWQEFFVIFNGPLAGFLLCGASLFIKSFVDPQQNPTLNYALEIAVIINLFWSILNLLPVLPLDGGHLMRVLLEGALGLRGTKISLIVSAILAALLSFFFFAINSFIAGVLFTMLAFESYRGWSDLRSVTPEDTNPQLHELLQSAQQEAKIGKTAEALAKIRRLQSKVTRGTFYLTATLHAAQILANKGDLNGAYNELYSHRTDLAPSALRLLQQWAYQLKKWPQAIEIGNQAYQSQPSGQVALTNALACAILGQLDPAIGWLKCAHQFNLPDWKDILTKREFDVIRDFPEFKLLIPLS